MEQAANEHTLKIATFSVSIFALLFSMCSLWATFRFSIEQNQILREINLLEKWDSAEMVKCRKEVFDRFSKGSYPADWSAMTSDSLHGCYYSQMAFLNRAGYLFEHNLISKSALIDSSNQLIGGAHYILFYQEDVVRRQFPYVFRLVDSFYDPMTYLGRKIERKWASPPWYARLS